MATIRKRQQKTSDQPLISGEDFQILLKFPIMALAALLAPEWSWKKLAIGIERALIRLNSKKIEGIGNGLSRNCRLVQADALQVLANQTEHHIQVLREFLVGWSPLLELSETEHLEAAKARGRGAVLWVAHFCFNSLASKYALARAGYQVHHVSRPEHGFSKSRFGVRFLNPIRISAERRYLGGRVVIDRKNPSSSMVEARRLLRKNLFVSITAGAWEGQLLVSTSIGHGVMELATGGPRLANAANAPLIPVFVVRNEERGELLVIVESPIPIDTSGTREMMIRKATNEFALRHGRYLEEFPYQWRDWDKIRDGFVSAASPK
jgi:lauroyl/myristoyl acyltransferase